MRQQRGQHLAPQGVAPAAAVGQQILQIVQHQQQGMLLQQVAQPWQGELSETLGIVQRGGQPQIRRIQLPLNLEQQVEQRAGNVAARLRCLIPNMAFEAAFGMAVGQFQRTGGLARTGHTVKQHATLGAMGRQGLAGPEHGLQTPDEPLRLGGEGYA